MPSSFVTAVSVPICAGDVTFTVTPGSAPPPSSTTCPLMLPVELAPPPWAETVRGITRLKAATVRLTQCFIAPPRLCRRFAGADSGTRRATIQTQAVGEVRWPWPAKRGRVSALLIAGAAYEIHLFQPDAVIAAIAEVAKGVR